MNITQQPKEALTSIIKIELEPSDYQENVDKVLKDYQKKANIPGFRPGKVPVGMIKKMYGKGIIAEESYKLVEQSLNSYIEDNNIETVGYPMPYMEGQTPIDWDHQEKFEFLFEIGLQAPIEIKLSKDIEVEYPEIIVEESVIDKYVEEIQRRHGHFHTPDTAAAGDMILGETFELDENGEALENGIKHQAFLISEQLNDDGLSKFIGAKKDDEIVYNPASCFKSKDQIATFLKIDHSKAELLQSDFKFKVSGINQLHPAELNEELFAKVFPNEEIHTVEEFRSRVSKDASMSYANESEQQFLYNIQKKIIEITPFDLPEDFLKRFILANNESKINEEQLNEQFASYLNSFRWQLIERKLVKDNNLEVGEEEVRKFVKDNYVAPYFAGQEISHELEHRIDDIVSSMLKKEEDIKKVYDRIYDQKLIVLFRENVKIDTKLVTYDEFIAMVTQNKL